ncbi:DMT family transporter [Acidobacteriota bacterium]
MDISTIKLLGEAAALTTAFCWSFTSIFFTIGGSRVGSVVVNRIRLIFALVLISLTHLVLFGSPFPFDAEPRRWLWLGLSALLGFVLGDGMLFKAFVVIGPRISMLMMATVPIISTVLAWVFLDERLRAIEITAILITLAGIMWVVADKHRDPLRKKGRQLAYGVLLGFGGAIGQATGLIASKKGLEGDFPAISANLIRLFVGTVIMWGFALLIGKARATLKNLKDIKATRAILGGAVCGPFLGVWLSLVAINLAPIGIAATLMAMTPVILIPLVHWIFKERITTHTVLGTLLAVVGVSMLVLL